MQHKKINEIIERNQHKFTSTEKNIATFVLNNPQNLSQLTTISKFSDETGFSTGAIMRFCKKLNFDGYSEFKFFIVNNLIEMEVPNDEDYLELLLESYIKEMTLLKTQLDISQVSKLANSIQNSQRVIIIGKNSSYIAAQQLQLRLIRIGISATVLNDELTCYSYVDILDPNDIVILFSALGYASKEYNTLINDFQNRKIPLHLITFNNDSEIFKTTKEKILLPNSVVVNQHLALDNQIFFIMFIEILLHKLISKREKKKVNNN